MRLLKHSTLIIAAAIVTACATAPAPEPVSTAYLSSLISQSQSYDEHLTILDEKFRNKLTTTKFLQYYSWDEMVVISKELNSTLREIYTLSGKKMQRDAYIEHIRDNPGTQATGDWFKQEGQKLIAEAVALQDETTAFYAKTWSQTTFTTKFFQDLEQLSIKQGEMRGKISELALLYNESTDYYTERARETAEMPQSVQPVDLQQSTMIEGMRSWLNNNDYTRDLVRGLEKPRNCVVYGNQMSCQ